MWLFFSLIPATLGVIVGYFILFSSTKAQGGVRAFGQILAVWVFVITVLLPIAGAYATFAGFSLEGAMGEMHSTARP